MNTITVILVILAVMVVSYIAFAVNYKERKRVPARPLPTIGGVPMPNARSPINTWSPTKLGNDPRLWTPTVYFKNRGSPGL